MKALNALAAVVVMAVSATASADSTYKQVVVNGNSVAEVQAKIQAKLAMFANLPKFEHQAENRAPRSFGAFSCDKVSVKHVAINDLTNTLVLDTDGTWVSAGYQGVIKLKCRNFSN